MTVDEMIEQYQAALKRQAVALADEREADENRKIVLAKQMLAAGDVTISKAEMIAKASEPYALSVGNYLASQREAEEAKGEVEAYRVKFEAWRTKSASAREMRRSQDG